MSSPSLAAQTPGQTANADRATALDRTARRTPRLRAEAAQGAAAPANKDGAPARGEGGGTHAVRARNGAGLGTGTWGGGMSPGQRVFHKHLVSSCADAPRPARLASQCTNTY
jgi:hypothetical protein